MPEGRVPRRGNAALSDSSDALTAKYPAARDEHASVYVAGFASTAKRPLAFTTFHASRISQLTASAAFARVVIATESGAFSANMRVPLLPGVSASIEGPLFAAGTGVAGASQRSGGVS